MPQTSSSSLLPWQSSAPFRVVLTLLLALAAAGLCLVLRTPLPWMIGPLLATAVLSMLGGPAESWTPLRNTGQWIIGGALGLYFTPQVVALVAGLWWAILLNIVWALALGLLFGAWLHRVHHGPGMFHVEGLSRITTYFAAPIGAASEMTLPARAAGDTDHSVWFSMGRAARTRCVAARHA
jgi:uncharacterized protein